MKRLPEIPRHPTTQRYSGVNDSFMGTPDLLGGDICCADDLRKALLIETTVIPENSSR